VRELSSICVFCGSSTGTRPEFSASARSLGRLLAAEGITMVYGGGSIGLMGVLADASLEAGGQVFGVIPRGLFRRESAHPGLTEMFEVDTMHERKQLMFELADAFVALPGGLGTVEELTEIATWAQLGIHAKPIATLDVGGYWQPLHAFLRSAADAGLVKTKNLGLIVNVGDVNALLPLLRSHVPPVSSSPLKLPET
jgi:uncharacterized protein (TIGR00730 family)